MNFNYKYGSISLSIACVNEKTKSIYTKESYRPKIIEYIQFYGDVYGNEENSIYVTEEKHLVLCHIMHTVLKFYGKIES